MLALSYRTQVLSKEKQKQKQIKCMLERMVACLFFSGCGQGSFI
jgi:hypothetical protein